MSEKIEGRLILKCRRCGKEIIDMDSSIVAPDKDKFTEVVSRSTPTGLTISSIGAAFGDSAVSNKERRVHWCDEWRTELGFLEHVGAKIE